jgi:integrase
MLTEVSCKQAKPEIKPYKLSDRYGLFLLIHPNGSKYWRWRHRVNSKDSTKAIGIYCDTHGKMQMSLKQARELVEGLRVKLRETGSIDDIPQNSPDVPQQQPTFKDTAEEWYSKRSGQWTEKHRKQVYASLVFEAYPVLGHQPIDQITPPEILAMLRSIEQRGANDVAHRTLQRVRAVFGFAIASGYRESNPAEYLGDALADKKNGEFAHLPIKELPAYFHAIQTQGRMNNLTEAAFWLLFYTVVRTTELIGAEWSEFDLENRLWVIPAARMKMGREHLVPLSDQVMTLLSDLKMMTGELPYIFPNRSNLEKPMSNMAILSAIKRAGYQGRMTGHACRKAFSTHANESNMWGADAIERQLAHVPANKVRGAYNKALHLPERIKLMQWWADYLDRLREM